LAVQELYGNETLALILIDFIDGADIRMIQSGGCTSFHWKPLQDIGSCETRSGQLDVSPVVKHSHTAGTKVLNDRVVRNGLANHVDSPNCERCYAVIAGKSNNHVAVRRPYGPLIAALSSERNGRN